MTKKVEQLAESKATSVLGAVSSISALLLAFVPADVLQTCTSAISETQNPLVIGGMLSAGILLQSIGPSLVRRSAK